jgi:hypothetical protein
MNLEGILSNVILGNLPGRTDENHDEPQSAYSESLGLWTLSTAWNSEWLESNDSKVDLFPSSGEEWEIPTLLGPLERANLNHWNTGPNRVGVFLSSPEEGNRFIFRNLAFPSY